MTITSGRVVGNELLRLRLATKVQLAACCGDELANRLISEPTHNGGTNHPPVSRDPDLLPFEVVAEVAHRIDLPPASSRADSIVSPISAKSAATISATSASNDTSGVQPSSATANDGSA